MEAVQHAALNTATFRSSNVQQVQHAVLTTPAYFSAWRRQALKDAFELGGLSVSEVIDELGAAAIDYAALHLPARGPHTELAVIYGAGATGVAASLVRMAVDDNGALTVHLLAEEAATTGGADVDEQLLAAASAQSPDVAAALTDARASLKLRQAVARVKEVCLKATERCPLQVPELIDGRTLRAELARGQWTTARVCFQCFCLTNSLCFAMFTRTVLRS